MSEFKMFDHSPVPLEEWDKREQENGRDLCEMNDMDFIESVGVHRYLNGGPVTNVWATLFFAYVALAFWINLFPEWTPAWMFGIF